MGYWILLGIGAIVEFMGLSGLVCSNMGSRAGQSEQSPSGSPLGITLIPLAIGAVLIFIAVIGLRKKKRQRSDTHKDRDTDEPE